MRKGSLIPRHGEHYGSGESVVRSIYSFQGKFAMINPTELLEAYAGKEGQRADMTVRDFVDQVVTLCPKPTFIRVLPKYFWRTGSQETRRKYALQSFVLSHAVQILLFASQDRVSNRVYSRDRTSYAHRFPTPDNIGGGTEKKIAGLFSMEDLHRAILLFYFMIKRRTHPQARPWIGRAVTDMPVLFPGYCNPDADTVPTRDEPIKPEAAGNLEGNGVSSGSITKVEQNAVRSGQEAMVDKDSNSIAPIPDAAIQANNISHDSATVVSAADLEERRCPGTTAVDQQDIHHVVSAAILSKDRSPTTGLKAVDINTEILESVVTTWPARSIRLSLRRLGEPEPPQLTDRDLQELLSDLKKRHEQPDFEARMARHRATISDLLIDQFSASIIVEECNFSQAWNFPLASAVQQRSKEHYKAQQESDGFDEQRKGMLISFDWRNYAILNGDDAKPFRETLAEVRSIVPQLQDLDNVTTNPEMDMVGIDPVNMLTSCGLRMLYRQAKAGMMMSLDSCKVYLRWLCQYSPIMTRALDLAVKNAGKRLLVYVDDPWIQW